MMNMECMNMHMYFVSGPNITCFLFKGWTTHGDISGVAVICVAVMAVCILLDTLKTLVLYLHVKSGQNPLTISQTNDNVQDRSPLLSSLIIPANITEIKRRRLKFHVVETLIHILNTALAYTIMLAVMSYSLWVGLSVAVGSGISYYIHGAVRASIQSQSSKRIITHSPDSSRNEVPSLCGRVMS
ncbi:protein SLC31A2-like [Liolophura sinensis]|uniref:protein SLC31A2-like n=1 Tax=Liolophura sinensis TaxID=3198878 RepID=UPI00315824C4